MGNRCGHPDLIFSFLCNSPVFSHFLPLLSFHCSICVPLLFFLFSFISPSLSLFCFPSFSDVSFLFAFLFVGTPFHYYLPALRTIIRSIVSRYCSLYIFFPPPVCLCFLLFTQLYPLCLCNVVPRFCAPCALFHPVCGMQVLWFKRRVLCTTVRGVTTFYVIHLRLYVFSDVFCEVYQLMRVL